MLCSKLEQPFIVSRYGGTEFKKYKRHCGDARNTLLIPLGTLKDTVFIRLIALGAC